MHTLTTTGEYELADEGAVFIQAVDELSSSSIAWVAAARPHSGSCYWVHIVQLRSIKREPSPARHRRKSYRAVTPRATGRIIGRRPLSENLPIDTWLSTSAGH
jgi:hypothetical protein